VKVFLLLAGRSQRFWPLTEKMFFPICGKTILAYQVDSLCRGGFHDITCISGHHNIDRVRALFPHLPCIEQEDLSLGMRGALLSALPLAGNEPVMIVGGNDVIDSSAFSLLAKELSGNNIDGAILAARVPSYFPGGYLVTENQRVQSIVEKPKPGQEPSDLVTIVAHAFKSPPLLLAALKQTAASRDDGYECALDVLFRSHIFHAVPYEGPWHPIKYPWHLLPLLSHLLQEDSKPMVHPTVSIHPSAVLEGNVHIEEGVHILPHATVKGPCFIGKRSVIANGALVRGASIGEDCVIGFSTEVKSSILSDHVWTHMTYIGDSVIGRNVSFGGGSLTGNLRLDEEIIHSTVQGVPLSTGLKKFGTAIGDDCRLGIRTCINPGVKIGTGAFIASGVVLSKDSPEGSYVSMKGGEVDVRPNRVPPPTPEGREAFRSHLKP
jgi:bifunctional UDP-N-acetylglucosamine pyrophosphorylase/glucosamine-1-phosphate N-acetyltransferase